MDLGVGELVLVDIAAFTASRLRNRETIPCEVLEIDADQLLIRTRFPYRVFKMWVGRESIQAAVRGAESASA